MCGLFRSSASLALCGESLDHGFSNIEFWGGYAAPPVETVQQLLRAAGIAQQVTLYFPFPWMAALTAYALCPAGLVAAGRRPHPGRPGAQGVPKGNVLVCFGRRFSACARPARPATVAPALSTPPGGATFPTGAACCPQWQSHRNRLFPEPLCQGCPRQMEHAGASHCRNARQCCGRKADAQQAAKKLHKFMKPIHLILRIIFVR